MEAHLSFSHYSREAQAHYLCAQPVVCPRGPGKSSASPAAQQAFPVFPPQAAGSLCRQRLTPERTLGNCGRASRVREGAP